MIIIPISFSQYMWMHFSVALLVFVAALVYGVYCLVKSKKK